MSGPLDGVKVIDMTMVGFGPYATQIMGDYGADVIKVEAPEGDITRGITPYRNPGMGHFYLMANRNKRCIVLDLKQPDARDVVLRMIEDADVLISSVRPAAMERLGLGYDACKSRNNQIIYVSLVGFGQDGPYAKRPAYDDIIQGMSGMAAMQGGREGPPRFVNASICDKIGSQFAVHATLAALFSRERTGKGQRVEVPMLESLVGFNLIEHQSGHAWEPPLGPAGYERSMVEYRKPYATRDGYVCVLPYNTKQWRSFFEIMDRPEMVDDPLITDPKTRSERIGDLYAMVAECVASWETDALLEALENGDIPNGRAVPLGELSEDPHLAAVGLFGSYDHPTEGRVQIPGPGVKFSDTPAGVRSLPENLGESSVALLREHGYDDAAIDAMLDAGATVDGTPRQASEAAE